MSHARTIARELDHVPRPPVGVSDRENLAERWARFQEWRDHRRDLRRDLREEEEELEARHSASHDEGNGVIPFSRFDAAANPELDNQKIGEHFNMAAGRISEYRAGYAWDR